MLHTLTIDTETTDAASWIQFALDTLPTVFIPTGSYTLSRGLRYRSGQAICGETDEHGEPITTLTLASGVNDSVFRNANPDSGNHDVIFESLIIDGNAVNNIAGLATSPGLPRHGIAGYNVNHLTLRNVTLRNCGLDGLYAGLNGSVYGVVVGGDNQAWLADSCTLESNWRAGWSLTRIDGFTARDCIVRHNNVGSDGSPTGNAVWKSAGATIEPNGAATCKRIHYDDCDFIANRCNAVNIAGANDATDGVLITGGSIAVTGEAGMGVYCSTRAKNIRLADIESIDCDGSGSAVFIARARRVTIERVKARRLNQAYTYGVMLTQNVEGAVVTGCQMTDFKVGIASAGNVPAGLGANNNVAIMMNSTPGSDEGIKIQDTTTWLTSDNT